MTHTDRLLKTCGATLARRTKHEVWRLPNGRTFVRAATPSDRRAGRNQLAMLRKLLEETQWNGNL
jgi:hypothetical protein